MARLAVQSILPFDRVPRIPRPMTHARVCPLIDTLPSIVPFVGPETQERTLTTPFRARLGANESTFGPSPKAIAAMAETHHWKYGDPENHDLRAALAEHLGCTTQNITVGEGIDALLGYLVRLTVGHGDAVVTSHGAYPTFNYHVAGFGGQLQKVPFDAEDREDLPALIEQARKCDAKLIYIANPDNPMGSHWSGKAIKAAIEKLPQGTLLVLDEAYIECAPSDAAPDLPWDDPRLIRMRTFSKVYGLAGARIGYGIGHPELIAAFNKVRNHFGVNRAAQAGALAALQDRPWLAHVTSNIEIARNQIAQIAQENGLTPLDSATNFVAIDCGKDGGFAKAVLDGLINRGVFVRMPFVAPQDRCIRVSCSGDADLAIFATALQETLAALN